MQPGTGMAWHQDCIFMSFPDRTPVLVASSPWRVAAGTRERKRAPRLVGVHVDADAKR